MSIGADRRGKDSLECEEKYGNLFCGSLFFCVWFSGLVY